MAEDASSKKFLISNFTNYKMTDSRPVMEQYNELLGILEIFTQHKINMDETIQVSCIIDKLPPSWKDFKHTLKHQKEELTLVELDSHMCIEESFRVQDNDKLKGNNFVSKLDTLKKIAKVEKLATKPKFLAQMVQCTVLLTHVKRTESKVLGAIIRLPDQSKKLVEIRNIECIFVRYAEHSKAFRFSSFPRLSLRIPNGTEDISGSVVPEEVVEEVVQQPGLELRKSNKNRTTKNFRHEFQLYLIKGTRDKVSNQHSYCFNVEDEPKTFDEAIKSQDVALWKEAINDG
ncbi:hypothetical protein Tco_0909867 [Tanacetum coccineum]|uniref:Zinc finger, CCHC-type n=1 Tax=Tanacetum coccineum TaxID=301880 RepID=A0ABQ5CSY5_9ASTR